MDWLDEIKNFPKFDIRNIYPDIENKEASKINSKYNKALDNALNDSVDIAIIELRKLSVLYPQAGQISILLACCQIWDEKSPDALKTLKKARASTVPLDLDAKIENYEKIAALQIGKMKSGDFVSSKQKSIIPSSPAIIEATPNRWKKAKLASDREKKEIMKKLNSNQATATYVKEDRKFDPVKFIYVFAIIILIVSVISIVVFTIPKAVQSIRASQQDSAIKLEWLLERMTQEMEDSPEVKKILREFDGRFFPTPEVSATQQPAYETPSPTLSPEPTPTPEPTASDKVRRAALMISEAKDIGRDDAKKVYELIYQAEFLMEGIDDNTKATGLDINKEDVNVDINQLMRTVVNAACYPFYRDGVKSLEAGRYEDAIEHFLKAFEIYPGYLDGINTYNLGKAYAGAKMTKEANEAFMFVIENYPGTDLAGWSQRRIVPESEN